MESTDSAPVRKATLGVLTAPAVLLLASWAFVLVLVVLVAALV